MFAIKRELKLNNVETSLMRGNTGFKRFVYNYGLELLTASWSFEGVKASDSKRIDAIKKVFTQVTMQKPEYAWMRLYPSTVYQSAFIDLKNAFSRWRKAQCGFPKKKSKKKGDSFTVYKTAGKYPEIGKPALPFTNRVVISTGKLIRLPGLNQFRLKERIDFICSSQTFTVSRTAVEEFRSQNSGVRIQSVGDSDPPLIEDHQIFNLVGVLNPFIHLPVAQNSILLAVAGRLAHSGS